MGNGALLEDDYRRPDGAVQKKLGSPFKVIRLAGFERGRAFKLADRSEGIAQSLFEVAQQPMQARMALCLRESLDGEVARQNQIAVAPVSQRQIVGVGNISAIDLVSGFKGCDGLAIFAGAQIKFAELVIRFETVGSPRDGGAQSVFRLHAFASLCVSCCITVRSFV